MLSVDLTSSYDIILKHMFIPFNPNRRHAGAIRSISLVVVCLFLLNDLAWAGPLSGEKDSLAVSSKLADDDFKRRFAARASVLEHPALNEAIRDMIKADKKIFGEQWERDRTGEVDPGSAIVRGNIKPAPGSVKKVKVVKVTGLFRKTGQFAHTGLSGRYEADGAVHSYGMPVIYVDAFYYGKSADAVLRHEIDEVLQWDELRSIIAEAYGVEASGVDMRRWIKEHITEADRRLYGTKYGGSGALDIARRIHNASYNLHGLYKAAGLEDGKALSRLVDYDHIRRLHSLYADWDSRDVNISAADDSDVPGVLGRKADAISADTPPEDIFKRLKFNDVPFGSEITAVWGANVDAGTLARYHKYLTQTISTAKSSTIDVYFSLLLLNITISTLRITSPELRNGLVELFINRQPKRADEDEETALVNGVYVDWQDGKEKDRDMPGEMIGLITSINNSCAGIEGSEAAFSVITERLKKLSATKGSLIESIKAPEPVEPPAAPDEKNQEAGQKKMDGLPQSFIYAHMPPDEVIARITDMAEKVKSATSSPKAIRLDGMFEILNGFENHTRAAIQSRIADLPASGRFIEKICDIYISVSENRQSAKFYMDHFPVYDMFIVAAEMESRAGDFDSALKIAEAGLKRLERSTQLVRQAGRQGQSLGRARDVSEDRTKIRTIMAKAHLRIGNIGEAWRLGLEVQKVLDEKMKALEVRDPELCGQYCDILMELANISVERTYYEDARRYMEQIIELSHKANLSYDNSEQLFNIYLLAGDTYLRGVGSFRDIDTIEAAQICADKAEAITPGQQETAVLRAWIKFEKGGVDGARDELASISDMSRTNSRSFVTLIRLWRMLALYFYDIGREEEARDICERLDKQIANRHQGSIGMRALLSGFTPVRRGYDAALAEIREITSESKSSGKLVISTVMNQVALELGSAMRKGEPVAVRNAAGEFNDYASGMLNVFEYEDFAARIVESESRINPPRIKEAIVKVARMMADTDDARISIKTKYRILRFLEYVREDEESPVWIIEKLEGLLIKMEEAMSAPPEAGNGGKRDKKKLDNDRAELKEKIRNLINSAVGSCYAGERLIRAKRMFDAGSYREALKESEEGLEAQEAPDDDDAKGRLNTYMETSSRLIQASESYEKQRYAMARLHYEKAAEELDAAGLVPGKTAVEGYERARRMTEAEEAYGAGDFERALRIAGEVDDPSSASFAQRVAKVQRAEKGPGSTVQAMARLSSEYPSDVRVKAFLSTLRTANRTYRSRLATANDMIQDVREILAMPDITSDDFTRIMNDLRKIRELSGYSNGFGNMMRDAARVAYSRGMYRISLQIAEFALAAVPQDSRKMKDELLIIARDSKAQMVSAKLHRQYEILDCHFQADNLRTKKKLNERGTLDYVFSGLKKDDDGATLEISGLSYEVSAGKTKSIEDIRSAINRGESYVLIARNADGRMAQFVLKAVLAEASRAVFKLESNEAARNTLADIPAENGILKKLKDPSLKERRDTIFERMLQLDNSLAEGAEPSTNSRFADILLELAAPSSGPGSKTGIDFRDERIAADPDQRRSVEASLDTEVPMTLIQGPPGTGKTSVIVEIVRQFRSRGKKVLVVSQSNAAVDNIAKRLLEVQASGETLDFARVGNNKDAVDPEVYKSPAYNHKKETLQAMRAARSGCVVLGTIGGFFSDNDIRKIEGYYDKFDAVIVEEAGRATLAETLVPLERAASSGKVVLVGDHKQLPPYGIDETQIEETIEELKKYMYKEDRLSEIFSPGKIREFKVSPFETLWKYGRALKDGVHRHFLAVNRRSHPAIAKLVSELFYDGRIVADPQKGGLPEEDTIKVIDYTEGEPLAERSDAYRAVYERRVGKSYENLREANILLDEIDRILNQRKDGVFRYGVKDITMITPFAPQRALLKEALGVKALMNRLRDGKTSGETAITAAQRQMLQAALKDGSSQAEAAIKVLAESSPDTDATKELVDAVTRSLIFDISPKHGPRSIMPEDLEDLGLLEVETVDSIQGSENKVVILSLVRSNTAGQIGFMGTYDGLQRLNVAFSRAQEKFIVIGDFTNTLTQARYIPSNPNPRSIFQRARRESTGRAQIVFKKTVEYYSMLKISPMAREDAPASAAPSGDKGSPARLLETIKDDLMAEAMSKEGFLFEDAARLRKYHRATVRKEVRTLIDLGILERVKAGAPLRLRFASKIRELGIVRTPALIDAINGTEYTIGRTDKPLDRYEIPDRKDVDIVRGLIDNTVGIEAARHLSELSAYGAEDDARYYVVRYNDEKLAEYARKMGIGEGVFREIIGMYVRFMRIKLGGADRVDNPKPTGGAGQPLISIECYRSPAKTGSTFIGRGRITIDDRGLNKDVALRIIDMANIAFAMSNIPIDAKSIQTGESDIYIAFIQNKYRDLTGMDILPEDIIKDDRLITLPTIKPIPFDKLPEYYELTIKQLAQAA